MANDDDEKMNDLFGSDDESAEEEGPSSVKNTTSRINEQVDELEDDMTEVPDEAPKRYLGASSESEPEDLDDRSRNQMHNRYSKPARAVGPPMAIEAPLLPLPPSDKLHLLRTSNIFGIATEPFDPATYQDAYADAATGAVSLTPTSQNGMIRWRKRRLPDGREVTESNARFVRWSDGSMQMLLGNEVLDVKQSDISKNNLYLFAVRQILQGQAHLTSRLALRPTSIHSSLHRHLREVVDKRHIKAAKVGRAGALQNPEVEIARRAAAVEERIKTKEVLQRKQDRMMSKATGGYGRATKNTRLSENYLEEEQDWETEGGGAVDYRLGAQKRRQGLDETEAARRLSLAKQQPQGPLKKRRLDEEEEEEEYDEDDDEEEEYVSSEEEERAGRAGAQPGGAGGPQGGAIKARRGVVLSDDEDE